MTDWLSVEEAAELTGYNREYVRQLIRRGEIAAEKKGWQWWVDQASIIAHLNASRRSQDKRYGPKSK